MADTNTVDVNQIADDLLEELNLDQSELSTIRSIVQTSTEIITRSSDASFDDKLTIPAIKTLSQAIYYDRSLESGMPNGLLMMLTHLQASTPVNQQSGDSDGK